jgi:hypothetical protein
LTPTVSSHCSGTVRMLASLPLKKRGKARRFNYPLFEAD